MTDYPINVIIKPDRRGRKEVENELTIIEEKANRLRRFLQNAFAAIATVKTIQKLVELADVLTYVQNRLGTVTRSTEELAVVTKRVFDIANETRTAFETTGEVYARVGLAARELGRSQEELLQFTETLNKAVVLSGAFTQEAKNGLIQLTQGLSSGSLRGDELRSVLEQLPVVADIIAKQIGVTRGQLRLLGAEGKISADTVLEAFKNAREEIAERFGKTVPTITQGFIVLRNKLIETIGTFGQSSGAIKNISKFLLFLATNIETVIRLVTLLTTALVTLFVGKGIVAAINGLKALSAAFLANPLTALPAIIALAVGALIAFGDQILISADSAATLQDLMVGAFQAIVEGLEAMKNGFSVTLGVITDLFNGVKVSTEVTLKDVLLFIAVFADATVGLFVGIVNAIIEIFSNIGPAIADVFISTLNGITGLVNKGISAVLVLFLTLAESAKKIAQGIYGVFAGLAAAVVLVLSGEVDAAKDVVNDAINQFGKKFEEIGTSFSKVGDRIELFSKDGLIPKISNAFEGGAHELGEAVVRGFQSGVNFKGAQQLVEKAFNNAEDRAAARQRELFQKSIDDKKAAESLKVAPPKVAVPNLALQKILDNLDAEIALLKLSNSEREIQNELLKIEKELREQGIVLTGEERAGLEIRVRTIQALSDQASVLKEVKGPFEEQVRRQQALNQLLADGRITQEEFNLAVQSFGLGQINKEISDEIALLELSNQQREISAKVLRAELDLRQQGIKISDQEKKDLEARYQLLQSIGDQSQLLDQLRGPQEQANRNIAAATELFKKGEISVEEYNQVLRDATIAANEAGTSIESGFTRGFAKVGNQLNDLASLSESTVVNAFGRAEDAIVEFARTGQFSFSALVDGILADLTRLLARKALLALFDLIAPGAGTAAGVADTAVSASNSGAGTAGAAAGGAVTAKSTYLVGEAGPELFVPDYSGSIVPHDTTSRALAQGFGPPVNMPEAAPPVVNVKVVNATTQGEALAEMETAEGDQLILNSITRQKHKVRKVTS